MSKVIVVDDDPTNAGLIKMLLELDGFTVIACTDISKANAATDETTAAFVVDCHLARGIKGIDLLNAIRSGATAAPSSAIVIMTSGDYRLEEESKLAGADLFLLKPYSPNDLSRELSALLAKGGQDGK